MIPKLLKVTQYFCSFWFIFLRFFHKPLYSISPVPKFIILNAYYDLGRLIDKLIKKITCGEKLA